MEHTGVTIAFRRFSLGVVRLYKSLAPEAGPLEAVVVLERPQAPRGAC